MREMNLEQLEYAVCRLASLVEFRKVKQTHLEQLSGVNQSTISKILSWSQASTDGFTPSEDHLKKLFQSLGLKLSDILNETESLTSEIVGYLATPLTGLSEKSDRELRKVVEEIRQISSREGFLAPKFEIYWPGDYTHPQIHSHISAKQVYVTDRSHASTHDFVILFCGSPSYGVGQENEIVTQAGVPAIRLVPATGMSRMMLGSFVRSIDIKFSGNLETGINFSDEELARALVDIRRTYFRHRALYRGLNKDSFGGRLKKLVDDRCGDNAQFAADIGISFEYLRTLYEEPFSVSNPSAKLLARMAARLGERVTFLLGEAEEADPMWVESNTAWRLWVENTDGLDARVAVTLRESWRHDYRVSRQSQQLTAASFRSGKKVMREADWDREYHKTTKKGEVNGQQELL